MLLALMILSGYKYGLILARVQSRRAGALGSRHEGCEVALHRALEKDKSTLPILGIMIFIAACLYMRVYKGCVDSYHGPEAETLVLYWGKCTAARLVHCRGCRLCIFSAEE